MVFFFQAQPMTLNHLMEHVPTPAPGLGVPSLAPEYLSSVLSNLTEGNIKDQVKVYVRLIKSSTEEQKADFLDVLHTVNASFPSKGIMGRTELQRRFMLQLATMVAPAWVSRTAERNADAIVDEASKTAFRTKYGFKYGKRYEIYKPQLEAYSNCRLHVMRLYYDALKFALSPGMEAKLGEPKYKHGKVIFNGLPWTFDYNKNGPVVCMALDDWQRLSPTNQKRYVEGERIVFIITDEFTATKRSKGKKAAWDDRDIPNGAMIRVTKNPHTGNPHVGINIVAIADDGENKVKRYVYNIFAPVIKDDEDYFYGHNKKNQVKDKKNQVKDKKNQVKVCVLASPLWFNEPSTSMLYLDPEAWKLPIGLSELLVRSNEPTLSSK